MKKLMEDIYDFLWVNSGVIMLGSLILVLAAIFFVLFACMGIESYLDYKVKMRALDIYEESGVMINIDMNDLTELLEERGD